MKKKEFWLHLAFWSFHGGWGLFIQYLSFPNTKNYLPTIGMYLVYIALCYFHALLVMPQFLKKKKWAMVALLTIFSWVVFQLLTFAISIGFGLKSQSQQPVSWLSWKLLLPLSSFFVQYVFYGFIYYRLKLAIQKERDFARLERREKLLLENAYLRSQMNSHFLFNLLNSFYSDANKYDPQLAKSIAGLSNLVRYYIREEDIDGKVPLADELAQIQQLVDLYRYRYEGNLYVQYTVEGNPSSGRIPPHALLTLVENGFKYGVLNDEATPLTITAVIEGELLLFSVADKKHHDRVAAHGGIGIENLKKRLQLAYNGKYDLSIKNNPNDYFVQLTLKI
jgi:sensor histidine kinase YesM